MGVGGLRNYVRNTFKIYAAKINTLRFAPCYPFYRVLAHVP